MAKKLISPCKICPNKNLNRSSEICKACDDTYKYAEYIVDPETFLEQHPNFKYSFEIPPEHQKKTDTSKDTEKESIPEKKEKDKMPSKKRCTKCKDKFPPDADHFHKNKRNKDGLSNWCKKCNTEYQKKFAAKKKKNKKKNINTSSKKSSQKPGASQETAPAETSEVLNLAWEKLSEKTMPELEAIKQAKMQELFEIREQKNVLIGNIISLQGMIQIEKGKS